MTEFETKELKLFKKYWEILRKLFPGGCSKQAIMYFYVNGFNLCYCLEDCISIIPDFLFYQIKSVNIRDIKKHTEVPKPIRDYLSNNIHILEEIKEIYLMNMLGD